MRKVVILLAILIGTNLIVSCGWIIQLDRGYHGTVIDADTKEPLEGVVVVAVYSVGCARPAEGYSKPVGARETLTNANGAFQTPFFWTVSSPNCFRSLTEFIVFKAGYGYSPGVYLNHVPGYIPSGDYYQAMKPEDMFRKGVLVELPRLTLEERRGARPDIRWELRKDTPQLISAVDREDRYVKEEARSLEHARPKAEVVAFRVLAVQGDEAILENVKTKAVARVTVGDQVEGSTVVAITPLAVDLERATERGVKVRSRLPVPQPVPPPPLQQ